MDTLSGKTEKKAQVSFPGRIVKCGRYQMTAFVNLEDCRKCDHHRGLQKIQEPVNGRPEVWDVLCGLPVHRRIEYVVQEVADGGAE